MAGHARHADRHAQIQYVLYTTDVRRQPSDHSSIPPRPTTHTHSHTLTHATGAPPRGHHQHTRKHENMTHTHTHNHHAISARTPTPLTLCVCGKNCRSTTGGKEGRPIVVLKNGYKGNQPREGGRKRMKDRMRPDSYDAHTHGTQGKARQVKTATLPLPLPCPSQLPVHSGKPKMPHPRHEEGMDHG